MREKGQEGKKDKKGKKRKEKENRGEKDEGKLDNKTKEKQIWKLILKTRICHITS